MSFATGVYLTIGIVATAVLALGILVGDLFDFGEAGGPFSLPVVAGFMGCFGYAGAITSHLVSSNAATIGALAGLVAAIPGGWGVSAFTRAIARQTGKTIAANDYVGATGVVLTEIAKDGYGEVSVAVGGQTLKLSARAADAEDAINQGEPITVVNAPTETLVFVQKQQRP